MKEGKEIPLSSKENYSVYAGTINNKNPKSVYLTINSWGLPKDDNDLDYDRIIRNLRKYISQYIYNNVDVSDFKKDITIVDLDMRSSGVKYNKKSFMCCEITLFQKNNYKINSERMVHFMENLSKNIITNIFENNKYFTFYKTKS